MRVLLQRVSFGAVQVDNQTIGQIDTGYVLLVGVGPNDTIQTAEALAQKVVKLRLFPNDQGKLDHNLLEVGGSALVISQFTLYGRTKKGRRPDFTQAAKPDLAEPLYQHFASHLRHLGVERVEQGQFGAHMDVTIHNDGPVTLWLDSDGA